MRILLQAEIQHCESYYLYKETIKQLDLNIDTTEQN